MALADDISDLLATFPEADRATMLAAFERNPNAATHLTQRETVYKAFVDGDTSALANATRTVTPPVVTSPAVDLDAINRTLDERMGKIFDDPRFDTAVERRAKVLADAAIKAASDGIVGRALKGGAEITSIMHTHRTEFGKELDQPAYEKFVTDNGNKFATLTDAYNNFVSEERINKRIEAARAEGAAHRATTEVPGTSLPNSSSPAGMFIKSNPMNTGAQTARGDAIDNAAAAFRTLQAARVQ
jgi:hypothetical protein